MILGVRAAGSWRAYAKLPRKKVLLLRSLALRGRAKPRDARMTFLVESPKDGAWLRSPSTLAHGARRGLTAKCLKGPVPLHRDPRPRLRPAGGRRRRRRVLVDASH